MGEGERRTVEAEKVLGDLSHWGPPTDAQATPAYRRVEVYDRSGRAWPGAITAWWTSPEGVETCRLRVTGMRAARWAVFDPDRIALLVQSGT